MFYAPWCGHCKLAKPAFQETAAAIKEEEGMKLAAVDCTIERGEVINSIISHG